MTSRRRFLKAAAALGVTAAWAGTEAHKFPPIKLVERRDLFSEGVASGDPDSHSVLLWTRRSGKETHPINLHVQVSETPSFDRIVAAANTPVSAAADWTCRVLVGNLRPKRVYWYRFIDADGHASRVGRTITAPRIEDPDSVRFAFVSCQNINIGYLAAWRRMIHEDEAAAEAQRLGFVLHLGDFIYERVFYPEDNPDGRDGRSLRDLVRLPHGEKIGTMYVPTTVEDYRALYRAYLHDPDLQDARARWPFVSMWDNHEFSGAGWQGLQSFAGVNRPAQPVKVAANQAWFEFQPARVRKSSGPSRERFNGPAVSKTPIETFDAQGLGEELNNRIAIGSLTGYRAFRYGRHVELLITDHHSYRSEDPTLRPEAQVFLNEDFPEWVPEEVLEILDAGRSYANANPPETIPYGDRSIANFWKFGPAQTVLGAEQKAWFLSRLQESTATWKIWGCSQGTLDYRADLQNLPIGLTKPWPGAGYAGVYNHDQSNALLERAEIYALVRKAKITGFATVSGDRHAFWAGLAAPTLPPRPFEPVGVAFVGGSITSPGMTEGLAASLPKDHPLYALYLGPGDAPEPVANLTLRHGVRAALEYHRTRDLQKALAVSNRELAPHLKFLDAGAQGYATVCASAERFECEFVCVPRPVHFEPAPDGGPIVYRVLHAVPLWKAGTIPRIEQRVIEGNPRLALA